MAVRRGEALFDVRALRTALPELLAPSSARGQRRTSPSIRTFTSSPQQCARNRQRGVSPMRRTGLRQPLSISKEPLPKPVLDPEQRTKVETDEDHGLWDFFGEERKALATPEDDSRHGRAWTVPELRRKSWEDLHSLWWICMKERNRIATSSRERKRLDAGFGDKEANDRDNVVKRSMRAIKHTLIERWYAWEHARKLAFEDPSVDLTGDGIAYERAKDIEGNSELELPDEPIEPAKEQVRV